MSKTTILGVKAMVKSQKEVKFYQSIAFLYYCATLITIGPAVLIGFFWSLLLLSNLAPDINITSYLFGTLWRLIVVALFLGTPFWIVGFYKQILNPLRKMGDVTETTGNGDLTSETEIRRNDELGVLAYQIDKMTHTLNDLVSQIKKYSERVSMSAQQLSAAAEQINSSTMEVSTSIQQIAKGSEVQAQKVDETSKSMKQISDSIHNAAYQSQAVAETSKEAFSIAQSGEKDTTEAIEKMNHVESVISDSANAVRSLGERSQEIGNIIDVITNIADQTNLLALNAAIEAARAGEYGRGFAVVADEVRKLADGTAKAADQIASLISEVQDETNHAVKSMEQGTSEVFAGVEVVNNAGKSLQQIIKAVQETAKLSDDISGSMQEQVDSVDKIEKAINEIAAVVEENAASTEETAAATEQQTASMQEVTASAQELSDMALKLDEVVNKFKVK